MSRVSADYIGQRSARQRVGRRMVKAWLREPVEHGRDVRSLLMLKLRFIARSVDARSLIDDQRELLESLASALVTRERD